MVVSGEGASPFDTTDTKAHDTYEHFRRYGDDPPLLAGCDQREMQGLHLRPQLRRRLAGTGGQLLQQQLPALVDPTHPPKLAN